MYAKTQFLVGFLQIQQQMSLVRESSPCSLSTFFSELNSFFTDCSMRYACCGVRVVGGSDHCTHFAFPSLNLALRSNTVHIHTHSFQWRTAKPKWIWLGPFSEEQIEYYSPFHDRWYCLLPRHLSPKSHALMRACANRTGRVCNCLPGAPRLAVATATIDYKCTRASNHFHTYKNLAGVLTGRRR